MTINNYKKRRTYYGRSGYLSTAGTRKTFLLRYIDDNGDHLQLGPFSDKEVAVEKLSEFLKDGICSWLVSYNG